MENIREHSGEADTAQVRIGRLELFDNGSKMKKLSWSTYGNQMNMQSHTLQGEPRPLKPF